MPELQSTLSRHHGPPGDKPLRRCWCRHWACGLLLISTPALAWGADPGAFSFSISHSRTDWQYPANVQLTRLTRAKLHLTEALRRHLSGTIQLIYLDLSQPDNPLPQARNASGNGLGISVQGPLLENEAVAVRWQLAYTYQTVASPSGAQAVEFVWQTWYSRLAVTLFPEHIVSLQAGASLGRIDGEQRNTGTLNQVRPFTESQRDSYYAGIRLHTDVGDNIELMAYTGARQALQLVFRHRF